MKSHALSDRGRKDAVNEDSWLADDARGLWIVSDGVGSYRGAAFASRLAVEAVAQGLSDAAPADPYELRRSIGTAIKEASVRFEAAAREDRALSMMSATLTMLLESGRRAVVTQIGDSRCYRLRAGRLEQITNDHSVAWEQFKIGAIPKEKIRDHPNQRLLTRTLGPGRVPMPEITIDAIEPGDRWLLCSDGLTKELDDPDIETLMKATPNDQDLAHRLVESANARGGRDNITVLLVGVPC